MIELSEPPQARLIVAFMWQSSVLDWKQVSVVAEKNFGKIKSDSGVFAFSHSKYYAPEMGDGLEKCFVEFEGLVARNALIGLKHKAIEAEAQFCKTDGRRDLNIDPMVLTPENIVISTSKAFPHRAYLGEGVFADVAFIRKGGSYQSLPWTYKDYMDQLKFFERVREGLPAEALFRYPSQSN